MPLIRLFLTTFTLSQAEQEKLRKRKSTDGQIKIRYTKNRISIEKDFPSVEAAVEWAESQRVKNRDEPDAYDEYTRVFGACEARDGQKCERLEGSWNAEEQGLFSSTEMEALGPRKLPKQHHEMNDEEYAAEWDKCVKQVEGAK